MITETELRDSFTDLIVEVLAVEPEEIRPDANFMSDLGGESIDLLELGFLCEKRFDQKIQFQHMVAVDEADGIDNGRLTEAALSKIESSLPFVDIEELRRDPRIDTVQRLLTIENLFRFLELTLRRAGIA